MINRRVLMSDADHFSNDQAINPYYKTEQIDLEKAKREHVQIAQLFRDAGIVVENAAAPTTSQDGVYTANWGLVNDKKAVLARLPAARKTEELVAEQALAGLGFEVFHLPEGWRFSGQGDSLPFDNLLFCGMGYRSDERAQAFVAETLGFERVQLQTIPELDDTGSPMINTVTGWADSFFYDLDLALAILREPRDGEPGFIAYCPEAFLPESRRKLEQLEGVEKILVSFEEATEGFACNLVSTGETVIMSNRAPHFQAELEKRGFKTVSPEVTELIKGGGFIRCVSLTLE